MFIRFARVLLLFLAVLGLMPGVEELVEELAEQIVHGHPAHSAPGESDLFCAEPEDDPCSGPACPCHAVPSVVADSSGVSWLSPSWSAFVELPAARQKRALKHPLRPETRMSFPAQGPPTPPPNA